MNFLIYQSIGIYFLSAIFYFLSGRLFIKKCNKQIEWRLAGWIWIITAIIAFIIGIGQISYLFGEKRYIAGSINQVFVWLQLITMFFYFGLLIVKKFDIVKKLSLPIFIAAACFFYFFITKDIKNIVGPIYTDWGYEFEMVGTSLYLFLGGVLIILILLFISLSIISFRYYKNRLLLDRYRIFNVLAVLFFILSGMVENLGWFPGWRMLLARIIFLAPSFMAYLIVTSDGFKLVVKQETKQTSKIPYDKRQKKTKRYRL